MKLAILLVALSLSLASCCKSEFKGELKFSKQELLVNPYSGTEELRFVDDTGKMILYNNGMRKLIEAEYPENQGIACSDYFVVQSEDRTVYQSLDPKSIITISIANQTNPFTSRRVAPNFRVSLENTTSNPSLVQYFADISVDSLRNSVGESEIFRDTINFRERTFRNVFIFPGKRNYQNTINNDTLYYSMNSGLVAIKYVTGTLWVIQ